MLGLIGVYYLHVKDLKCGLQKWHKLMNNKLFHPTFNHIIHFVMFIHEFEASKIYNIYEY
jgi:hypothetical protein